MNLDKKRQERTDYVMILLQYSISSIYSNAECFYNDISCELRLIIGIDIVF
ncbi:hypothetical protein QEZ44_24295 [Bacillus cereus]|nr:hypothetical protein [Bacillus cereus]